MSLADPNNPRSYWFDPTAPSRQVSRQRLSRKKNRTDAAPLLRTKRGGWFDMGRFILLAKRWVSPKARERERWKGKTRLS